LIQWWPHDQCNFAKRSTEKRKRKRFTGEKKRIREKKEIAANVMPFY